MNSIDILHVQKLFLYANEQPRQKVYNPESIWRY